MRRSRTSYTSQELLGHLEDVDELVNVHLTGRLVDERQSRSQVAQRGVHRAHANSGSVGVSAVAEGAQEFLEQVLREQLVFFSAVLLYRKKDIFGTLLRPFRHARRHVLAARL